MGGGDITKSGNRPMGALGVSGGVGGRVSMYGAPCNGRLKVEILVPAVENVGDIGDIMGVMGESGVEGR